jgi:hypothetical protein
VFRCCLPPGHTIGTPFPLIKEIKPEEIQNLKKRFSGRQASSKEATPPTDSAQLEKEVATQGEAVRKLKSAKADKKDIDAAVAKLLDLKKQLAASQTKAAETKQEKPAAAPVVSSPAGVVELEKEVATQGEAVRKLKSAKADKKDIDAAVAKLLDLKKQLAAVTGHEPAAAAQTGKKKGGNKKLIH